MNNTRHTVLYNKSTNTRPDGFRKVTLDAYYTDETRSTIFVLTVYNAHAFGHYSQIDPIARAVYSDQNEAVEAAVELFKKYEEAKEE